MPSGYLKNAEGRVSEKAARGSSSKDSIARSHNKSSPRSTRAPRVSIPSRPLKRRAQPADTHTNGGCGDDGSGDGGGKVVERPTKRGGSPKLRGPAATNTTKRLAHTVTTDEVEVVDPLCVAAAMKKGRQRKAAVRAAATDGAGGRHPDSPTMRVAQARAPLVEALRRARAEVAALDEEELETSRAIASLRIAQATLEGFDALPAARASKADPLAALSDGDSGGEVVSQRYSFTAVDAPDWAKVTQWRRLARGEYDEAEEDEVMGEPLGDGRDDAVVELSCSVPGMRCVFRESVVRRCLQACPKCPKCSFQFAIPGPQPSGTLAIDRRPTPCEGHPKHGSILMYYSFPSGTQGPRMVRPGQRYSGTSRCGYLPDSPEGRGACALLIKAFLAGQLFVVGDSVTTGATNCVVWGGVHQKTSPSGGVEFHGWPDPTYFERLMHECAAVGVFTDHHEKAMRDAALKARKADAAVTVRVAAATTASSVATVGRTMCAATAMATDDLAPIASSTRNGHVSVHDLQARVTELNTAVQAAMRSQNVSLIRTLMAERATAQNMLRKAL